MSTSRSGAEDIRIDTMRAQRCRRPARQHDRLGRAHHAYSDRHHRHLAAKNRSIRTARAPCRSCARGSTTWSAQKLADARAAERKDQIGSGDRSQRIRTYNFPQGRVTDHRVNVTLYNLPQIMEGEGLDTIIDALITEHQASQLAAERPGPCLIFRFPKRAPEYGGAIRQLSKTFREAGLETAALDARLLASHVCGLSAEETIAKRGFMLSPEMTARMNEAAVRRLGGEPVSRIVGRREFWGLPFGLSPHTLDPRPETELLVEAVLAYAREEGLSDSPLRILDLGTGTGCLLGAILSELPLSYGVGVDLSLDALEIARQICHAWGCLPVVAPMCILVRRVEKYDFRHHRM